MNYKELKEAKEILRLGESGTLEDVKRKYRELVKKYHPDKCPDQNKIKCSEMFQKINKAYNTIIEYCKNYKFPFNDNEFRKYSDDDEWWMKHFGDDQHWSNKT